ncbi:hypothetical protein KC640_02790 [Candidatus Dojkabacteria bacterium]|uniref:Uncharacterized protein n=1 Tax=Candidatus Dojkabacteria bacterium TaxID=2099670 RepID=A0A955I5G2_9BACT|nr:hypothetical protein [Candidatus Dojkabacteria bacterium]
MIKIIGALIIVYLVLGLQVAFGQTALLAFLQPIGWLAIALWLARSDDNPWYTFGFVSILSIVYGLLVATNLGTILLSLSLTILVWQGLQRLINLQIQNLGQILVFFNIWQVLWLLLARGEITLASYLSFIICNTIGALVVVTFLRAIASRVSERPVHLG